MPSSKKREKQTIEDEQANLNMNLIAEFAEVISQQMLEKDLNQLESFELYAHQLRSHLHSHPEIFKSRFSEGYRILVKELEKDPLPDL